MIKFRTFDTMQRNWLIENDGTINIKSVQDVEPILNYCEEARNNEDKRTRSKSELVQYAKIPVVMWEAWAKEAGIPGSEIFSQKMNEIAFKKVNSDFPAFKLTNTYEPTPTF